MSNKQKQSKKMKNNIMLFGTIAGVYEFDGYGFTKIKTNSNLELSQINSIIV